MIHNIFDDCFSFMDVWIHGREIQEAIIGMINEEIENIKGEE